jgi:drug/metabolite transporter (DMT)-like permease
MFITSIGITIISNTLYHIIQKLTPANAHPMLSLAATYLAATLLCLAFLPLFPLETDWIQSIRELNWTCLALGVAIVGLELGFLLAYRSGWKISTGGLVSNVSVSMLLLPVGFLFFSEKLSPTNLIGVATCILGLVLVNWH